MNYKEKIEKLVNLMINGYGYGDKYIVPLWEIYEILEETTLEREHPENCEVVGMDFYDRADYVMGYGTEEHDVISNDFMDAFEFLLKHVYVDAYVEEYVEEYDADYGVGWFGALEYLKDKKNTHTHLPYLDDWDWSLWENNLRKMKSNIYTRTEKLKMIKQKSMGV